MRYLTRKEIDVDKYDACIANSSQTRVYAFSWYLDIVADNWSVLVLNDYEAVMPLPYRKKYFITYVYPPFWLLELGAFSVINDVDTKVFLKAIFQKFRFVELRMNTQNHFQGLNSFSVEKQLQHLSLDEGYMTLSSKYQKDRKKDLRRAVKADLVERWDDHPENLIRLFRANVGLRTKNIKEKDYTVLHKLMTICIEKKIGEVLSVYNTKNEIVASGFFLKHQKTVTILVSATDFKNRKNGANTFLIDRAMYKFQHNFDGFNFGGSSIHSVAKFFKSFGATNESYFLLRKRLL